MTSYELSRGFWDFAFENTSRVNPNHSAMYFFAIEHCNRLGWKKEFGFPASMVIEAMGIKSYNLYKKTFDDLVEFGFFKVLQYSKNQYSSNIIALISNDKAQTKALDKASINHESKQQQSTYQSIDSIIKQINSKQLTLKQVNELQKAIDLYFDFNKNLNFYFDTENFKSQWKLWKVYKNKKHKFTYFDEESEQKALTELFNLSNQNEKTATLIIRQSIDKGWKGFFELKDEKPTPPPFVETRLKK